MKKWLSFMAVLVATGILITSLIIPAGAQGGGQAQIPTVINYQGFLTNSEGTPIEDPVSMIFSMYDVSSGGSPVWTETHGSVDPDNGLFTVMIGSGSPIYAGVLTGDRWLGVKVGADDEMVPRQKLTSVAYALRADTANSATALNAPDGSPTNAVYVDNEGNIGLGTESPLGLLYLANGDDSLGSNNKVQLALGYNGTNDYSHWITTRHNSGATNNAFDFHTSDGTANGLFPANAVHGLTISNGKIGIGTTEPSQEVDVKGNIGLNDLLLQNNKSSLLLGRIIAGQNDFADIRNYGDTWNAKDSNKKWRSIAMSADGTIQTAVVYDGQIYISADSGNTWTARESNRKWTSVAMSVDGVMQTAVAWSGRIYVSTDSGNTWTAKGGASFPWSGVAMSADGVTQTAVGCSQQIYVSTDSGNTWYPKDTGRCWSSVGMSADGVKQTALDNGGYIYVSTDSGNTWEARDSERSWRSVAVSADGNIQTAVVSGGQIYVSTDSGNTWTATESVEGWRSVAMSANGSIQTALVFGGQIYISTDSGNTWTARESNRNWQSIAMSTDGTKQTAVDYTGQVYVSNADICFESNIGVGTTSPEADLHVSGDTCVTGKVGIGTTSPSAALHVSGTTCLEGNVGVGTTIPTSKLEVDGRIKDKTGFIMPVGTVLQYAGNTAPEGWLTCSGTAVSRTIYDDLFAVIDTTYGVGNGSTTFNLPNLCGRIPVGLDSAQSEFDSLGEIGGEKEHTLTVDEMPSHDHEHRYRDMEENATNASGDYYITDTGSGLSRNAINHEGGDQPHNNLQPYIVMNYIIKY